MTKQLKKHVENQSQSGRSMIEMLGVLAIIAILSIGGIVGFRLAMNYYQANQIAHEMNIMRTDAQIKIAQGVEKLTLGSPYDAHKINFNDYGTDFGCALADDENVELGDEIFCYVANAYYIELQNIPEGVCKPLARLINGMDNLIDFYVNEPDAEGENKDTCNKDFNTLTVVFGADSDSNAVKCDDADECPDNLPICLNHVCVECETYHDCQGETPQCDEASHTCKSCAEIDPNKPLWDNNECKDCPEDQPWNGESCGCKDNSLCFTAFGNDDYYCHKTKKTNLIDGETGACKKIDLPIHKTLSDGVEVWLSANIVNYWNTCRLCEARAGKDGTHCSENSYQSPNMVDLDFFQCADKEKIAQTFQDNTDFWCHKTSADITVYDANNVPDRVKEIAALLAFDETAPWLTDVSPELNKTLRMSLHRDARTPGWIGACVYGHDEVGGNHFPICR